jgi:translation elongation factor EF-Ts
MREYKLVYLNKGFSTSREKDIEKAEKQINEMADQGWILQQVVTPDDGVGAMVGVF